MDDFIEASNGKRRASASRAAVSMHGGEEAIAEGASVIVENRTTPFLSISFKPSVTNMMVRPRYSRLFGLTRQFRVHTGRIVSALSDSISNSFEFQDL